jgi:hypothetical protein
MCDKLQQATDPKKEIKNLILSSDTREANLIV